MSPIQAMFLRLVVSLSYLSNNRLIHSVRQSRHPASPHYDNFIDLWRNSEYILANWSREQAEAGKHGTLTLEAYTLTPAVISGMGDRLGKIALGYLADLVVLDQDPFTCQPEDLHRIKPIKTMVAGEWVFEA